MPSIKQIRLLLYVREHQNVMTALVLRLFLRGGRREKYGNKDKEGTNLEIKANEWRKIESQMAKLK
jgi:hypothetical protein